MMKLRLFILLATIQCLVASAAVNTGVLLFDNRVKSLTVAPLSNPYLPPIYVLGSDDVLNVNFDVLDADVHYLRYSVTHCNADWQPSVLVESEYVDGFNQADINDYAQSYTTFVNYYNYNFMVPNDDLHITKSGNYVLTVYEQDDPDKILFQTRFSVSENSVGVYGEVTSRTDVDYNDAHQQLKFDVTYRQGQVSDPYNELTAIITQNNRADNSVVVTKPLMVSAGKVTYDHNPQLIFPAGNEYRRFETVNMHTLNMGVESIQYFEPYYHATLITDQPRATTQYLYDQTQHGHFTIRNAQADDSFIESEYLVTHFSLFTGEPLSGGNIFVQGAFADGVPASQLLMRYDESSGCYLADILLKQGAYNYQYLWVPDGTAVGETWKIEGDKYQTVNQYLIKVYDRPFGERYDHLVGFGIAYSGR
ncbi:MAG: DUF5103 domain-containing protein [Muribaculaceae bacterium]|nr:DUF5103 domain-containing protein [Muribaculaceae bacterium]